MAKLSKDLGLGTLHPRETLYATANLAAVNAEVAVAADGAATVLLDLRGTFNLTVTVEATIDGANWTAIPMRPVNAAVLTCSVAIAGNAAGMWAGCIAGYRSVRARCAAYSSGAATAVLTAALAPLDPTLAATVTPVTQTGSGASGAGLTLTLSAPGAGLRHYLTFLTINRYAAAVLTASATPIVVTTSNLPGAPAFTFPAEAAALGTIYDRREDFAYPLAASAPNSATTIVCPATTGVIWRATAGYYLGP